MDWSDRWTQSLVLRAEKRKQDTFYTVVDTRLAREWGRWKIILDAANLFNENYISSGFAPQPGRWITLGVQTRVSFF